MGPGAGGAGAGPGAKGRPDTARRCFRRAWPPPALERRCVSSPPFPLRGSGSFSPGYFYCLLVSKPLYFVPCRALTHFIFFG